MLEQFLAIIANKGILLSLLGGLGSYLQGTRDGRIKHGVFIFLTEMNLALVVGLIVMYIGEWADAPLPLVYVFILVLSNNSSDTWEFFKQLAYRYLVSKVKVQGK